MTFGVKPERPATEYGYISLGEDIDGHVHSVTAFVEKPDPATAARYVADGYLWNSGNFMFRADTLLEEYGSVDAASVDAVIQAIDKAERDLAFVILDKTAFESAKPISIDYAVMEKTTRAAVLPVSFSWSDVGSWQPYGNCPRRTNKAMLRMAPQCLRTRGTATCRQTRR